MARSTILVIDDEAFVLNLAVPVLKKMGYTRIQRGSDGIYGLARGGIVI